VIFVFQSAIEFVFQFAIRNPKLIPGVPLHCKLLAARKFECYPSVIISAAELYFAFYGAHFYQAHGCAF
jgi:hypothetical protein